MIYITMVMLVLMNSYSQILLKKGAGSADDKNILLSFLNRYTFTGYFLFLAITVINVFLLKYIDLKQFTIILSCNYLIAYMMAIYFLKESFSLKKVLGTLLIVIGVIVFNLRL
ncbi:EamA family transporter [Paenibacillus wenxiniae]